MTTSVKLSTSVPVSNAALRRNKNRNGQISKRKQVRKNIFDKKREEKIRLLEGEKALEKVRNQNQAHLLNVKIQIQNIKTHQLKNKLEDAKQSCQKAQEGLEELRKMLNKPLSKNK